MAPLFDEFANDLRRIPGVTIDVITIENSLFGGQVSVAGLVPGQDVIRALASQSYDRAILPRVMFDMEGRQTIDGVSPQDIATAIERELVVGSSPSDLVEATLFREPPKLEVIRPREQENE
jgi:NifB/MoaA-like Fe-S oxidoreductase